MSVSATAAARVSVTTIPAIDGVPLRLTVPSSPPRGVFFTVNADVARFAAAPSASLNVSVSVAPSTEAL